MQQYTQTSGISLGCTRSPARSAPPAPLIPSDSSACPIGVSNRMVMPNRLNRFSLLHIIDSKPIGTYLRNYLDKFSISV